VSTPSDLVKFISALFAGQLVSDKSLNQMKTIKDGLGMGMQQFPCENKTLYGHAGAIDGFGSMLCYFPDEKLAVSYCSNGTVYSINDILLRTINIYFNKPEKLPEFTTYNVKSEELDQFTGVYSSPQIPLKLTITKKEVNYSDRVSGSRHFHWKLQPKMSLNLN
jgi:CubicO group peptidase (beta-lactamase class C family)